MMNGTIDQQSGSAVRPWMQEKAKMGMAGKDEEREREARKKADRNEVRATKKGIRGAPHWPILES